MKVESYTYGDQAIRVVFGDKIHESISNEIRKFCYKLEQAHLPEVIEWVPSFTAVTIYFDPIKTDAQSIMQSAQEIMTSSNDISLPKASVCEIPVFYGGEYGPDLRKVAENNKLTEEDVINIHTSRAYLVYMIGFTPGFPYLGGMDESIACPRLDTPRKLVKAGSVGIAGSQTGMYSLDSPGGWNIIGRSPVELFHKKRTPPALLQQGNYVRFYPIDEKTYRDIREKSENGDYTPVWREKEDHDEAMH
ncbi:5-oxoprolinase subunit PxpB [Alteribacillus sp. HJP-4]|uniref:5-oxoprolinase subunit PxpB n=1 Tax=Alteribacillus sp. HJP-4 TaxID=2775394 RepID=UPI0035CCDC29